MPGYSISIDEDMVEMRTKQGARPALPLSSPRLYRDTYEQARRLAPG